MELMVQEQIMLPRVYREPRTVRHDVFYLCGWIYYCKLSSYALRNWLISLISVYVGIPCSSAPGRVAALKTRDAVA